MAILATGVLVTLAGRTGRVWLYFILLTSGRGLVEGNRQWWLAGLRLPEDKTDGQLFSTGQ
jgi:hypothetical protein